MAEFGYKQLVSAEALRWAAFDLEATVDLFCEGQLRRSMADAGLVPDGAPLREKVPLVFQMDADHCGYRRARDDEEPEAFEFRYLQYAAEVDS